MRISYWSSDVCSSDLLHGIELPFRPVLAGDGDVDALGMTRLRQQRPRLLRAIAHRRQGGVAGMHRRHQVMLRRLPESPEGEAGASLDIDGEPQRTATPRTLARLVVGLHSTRKDVGSVNM